MAMIKALLGGMTCFAGGYALHYVTHKRPTNDEYIKLIEQNIETTEDVKTLLDASKNGSIYFYRPCAASHSHGKPPSLTCSTLLGPGMISVDPYLFWDSSKSLLSGFYHLGDQVCGHISLVHGGMLATLLDECLGRCAGQGAKVHETGKRVLTANLGIDYRKPVKPNQVLRIDTWVEDFQGKKLQCRGKVSNLNGDVLVEGQALFIVK